MASLLPYTITYLMLTGSGRREAATAQQALHDVEWLAAAGASDIRIFDARGAQVATEHLRTSIGPRPTR